MTFKVSSIKGTPQYDALPVAKVVDYPLEKRDYKPYAQNQLCVGEECLYLRMWAFEVSPMPTSELLGVFYLFPTHPALSVGLSVVVPEGESKKSGRNRITAFLLENGRRVEGSLVDAAQWAHPYNGEDLQGVYWGETVALPIAQLEKWGGEPPSLGAGARFSGNFYKLCSGERFAHQGSFFPADFETNPYGWDSMGVFEVVEY